MNSECLFFLFTGIGGIWYGQGIILMHDGYKMEKTCPLIDSVLEYYKTSFF